jgi:type III pantothenate kinase
LGTQLEIEGFIEKYSSEYDDLKVIITGGDSNYLSGKIKNTIFTTSNYVFKGLEYLIEANK